MVHINSLQVRTVFLLLEPMQKCFPAGCIRKFTSFYLYIKEQLHGRYSRQISREKPYTYYEAKQKSIGFSDTLALKSHATFPVKSVGISCHVTGPLELRSVIVRRTVGDSCVLAQIWAKAIEKLTEGSSL